MSDTAHDHNPEEAPEPACDLELSASEEAEIVDARRRGLFKPPPKVPTILVPYP
jgi:hypothetical protein